MRLLAALMLSMLLLTTALLTRALVDDQQPPASRPALAARDESDEHVGQLLARGR